jgi:hypothetical protein
MATRQETRFSCKELDLTVEQPSEAQTIAKAIPRIFTEGGLKNLNLMDCLKLATTLRMLILSSGTHFLASNLERI